MVIRFALQNFWTFGQFRRISETSKEKLMLCRVQTPLTAVKPENDGHFRFVTLSRGDVVEIVGEADDAGLVRIRHEGQILAVFVSDIGERAEMIEAAAR